MKNNILKIGMFAAGLMACEKVIEVDVPFEQPKLVLNTILNPDSSFTVHLSKSQYILDNAPLQDIIDANIKILEGDEIIGEPGYDPERGGYVLDGVKPEIGKTYTVRAEKTGMESVEGQEKVPVRISVSDTQLDTLLEENYEVDLSIEFRIQDPATEKDFYFIQVYEETIGNRDRWGSQDIPEEFMYWRPMNMESPDPVLEPMCFSDCGFLLSDELFNGKSYTINLNGTTYNYDYGNPPDDSEKESESEIYLALYHIPESAYLYLKTLEQNRNSGGDPFAEPAKVFTNVKGGYGIITSMTPVYVKLTL